jgi:predicted MPP superfamily phosphohydrolase
MRDVYERTAMMLLKGMGLWKRSREEYFNLCLRRYMLAFPNLPAAFSGKKVLFISDLHYPARGDFHKLLLEKVRDVDYDYCFLGGDFAWGKGEFPVLVCRYLTSLVQELRHKTDKLFAVYGNHDSLFIAKHLEDLGVHVLVNEGVVIREKGAEILVSGIGEKSHQNNENWDALIKSAHGSGVEFKVLLAHKPHHYKLAEKHGFSMMLSGHTHAGQFCLPGGIPIITNSTAPRYYCRGHWQYRSIQGITSAGAGSSRLTARLNCPGEVNLITLIRG